MPLRGHPCCTNACAQVLRRGLGFTSQPDGSYANIGEVATDIDWHPGKSLLMREVAHGGKKGKVGDCRRAGRLIAVYIQDLYTHLFSAWALHCTASAESGDVKTHLPCLLPAACTAGSAEEEREGISPFWQ
jgi:hypothetical protein